MISQRVLECRKIEDTFCGALEDVIAQLKFVDLCDYTKSNIEEKGMPLFDSFNLAEVMTYIRKNLEADYNIKANSSNKCNHL